MRCLGSIYEAATSIAIFTMFAAVDSSWSAEESSSSWGNIPDIIESISDEQYREPLKELHRLTLVKLGYPQISVALDKGAHAGYMRHTKERWRHWWQTTGDPISRQRGIEAKADPDAFALAMQFFGLEPRPETIPPVWIPSDWWLCVTFSNGDYGGREQEVWMMEHRKDAAQLTKLRADFASGEWRVTLREMDGFTADRADRILKAISYMHRFAPETGAAVPDDEMEGLYYPHATLHLWDGEKRVLWNTRGYDFQKSVPEFGGGESGQTYYFLRSIFPEAEKWRVVSDPTSGQLAPYREFLSLRKPYFCGVASEIVRFFGQNGGRPELRAMLEWAEKQKVATDPDMDWKVLTGDFGAGAKVNVINSTRFDIQKTLREIRSLESDLQARDHDDADEPKVRELEDYVRQMLEIERQEKHDALERHPEPLRSLIKVMERVDDPHLASRSEAINAIRKNPDPELFRQLVQEMHEGTARIKGLFRDILLGGGSHLELKPWGAREEAIAINACIDSVTLAKNWEDLVGMILRVCGGGRIEMEVNGDTRMIEVIARDHGYSTTYGGATAPLPLDEAKDELRRLYRESRAGRNGD